MSRFSISLLLFVALIAFSCSSTHKAATITGIKTKLVPGTGLVVAKVDEGSEAFQKGVRADEMVKSVNGKAVANPSEFAQAVLEAKAGSEIKIEVASKSVSVKKTDAGERNMTFGISLPFLFHKGAEGTSIVHVNGIRFRQGDWSGFMLFELLGYMKHKDGSWGARIAFIHFGSESIKPQKGSINPDL